MSLTYHAFITLVGAILATVYLVPKVISIVKFKQLMDDPNERSSHFKATPSLGGVAFYMVFVLSLYFNDKYDVFNISMSILPGLTILFFLGLKDDLIVLAPSTKLMGQIISCLFVLFHYKFEVESFHGFFGIYNLHPLIGGAIGLIMMLTIINAFNLIDGIDGLAASIGIVAFTSFGFIFFFLGRNFLALSALTMCGVLAGFLLFNLSQRENRRIFMGDTGSMLIGFLIAVMSLRLMALELKSLNTLPFDNIYLPLVIFSILSIPLYDTLRVFTIRMMAGRSPFSADRNHLHHILLDAFGMSHRRTSFVIAAFSGITVVVNYLLMRFTNVWITMGIIILGACSITYFLYYLKKRISSQNINLTTRRKNNRAMRHDLGKSNQTEDVGEHIKTPM